MIAVSRFAIVLALMTAQARAWTDVWGTNATPRGMLSNVTAWVVPFEITNITATATNVTRYWTHISPYSNRVSHVQTNAVIDTKQRREYEAIVSVVELLGDRYATPFFRTVYWYRSQPKEISGGEYTEVDTLANIKGAWVQAHGQSAKRAHVDSVLDLDLGDSAAARPDTERGRRPGAAVGGAFAGALRAASIRRCRPARRPWIKLCMPPSRR
jgi:hypothetical protein